MCGITGSIDKRGVAKEDIDKMNEAIRHRGPDDDGILLRDTVGLGHRRLSIIDLASGHQPMKSADGAVWIVFNGEIYNYQELRSQLAGKYQFQTNSDTEVLLCMYLEKGEACLKELRGMFGFAIYDTRNEKLFAARDHLGQKPFYYWHHDNGIAFSSEIKALLALNSNLREMNLEALYEYFTVRIITPPRSMFKSIKKLPPAHYLTYQNGNLEIKSYWSLNYRDKIQASLPEAVDLLDKEFERSVKYHLISDVPVGSYLSGGVDSGLIVAKTAKLSENPINTFTGQVDYKGYGELPYAEQVSARYGTQNHVLKFKPSFIQSIADIMWHLDEPSDPLSVAMYYISSLAREHVKVVLGGDGGDELFGGYDRYYGNVYAKYLALIPASIRKHIIDKLLNLMPDGGWYQSSFHQLKWLNRISLHDGSERYAESLSYFYFSAQHSHGLYTEAFKKQIRHVDPTESIKHYFDSANADEVVDKMLNSDSMIRMPDHPVMISDRMTMAHGLEARSPFLDHKLAEFCAKLPVEYKVRGRTRRYIQLELAKRYLPHDVIFKKKQGFASPIAYILKDEYKTIFQTYLQRSRLVDLEILRPDFLQNLLNEHITGKADHGQRLWLIANAELWYRMYIEGETKESIRETLTQAAA